MTKDFVLDDSFEELLPTEPLDDRMPQRERLRLAKIGWTDEAREAAAAARARNVKPNIYMRPEDLRQTSDGTWQHKERRNIMSAPIAPGDVPSSLFHVTTNLPAVQESGFLKGQSDGGGLGGGNNMEGVSFTSSRADAEHIQRALRREIEMAHLPIDDRGAVESTLKGYARDDEARAGLPGGTLEPAVGFAMNNYDANHESRTHGWNSETSRYEAVLDPEELARHDRSGRHEAHAQYNQLRESKAGDAAVGESGKYSEWKKHPAYQWTKNPMLLSGGEQAFHMEPEHVGTLAVPRGNIPEGALVRQGSDDFLHEIRVHADVPTPGSKVTKVRGIPKGNILAPDPDETEPSIEAKAGVDGKVRLGAEFEQAAKYVLAHPDAVLVHGTRTIGDEVLKHAWVELPGGEVVYDGGQGKFFVSYDYKSKMRAETQARYRKDDTVVMLRKSQHFGPWHPEAS